ncbi:MAG: hypothetical protein KAQ83_04270 [Nanoarchaeota archaeon]|nr:hypothetical protein [Nanoarchaeota archaeon]
MIKKNKKANLEWPVIITLVLALIFVAIFLYSFVFKSSEQNEFFQACTGKGDCRSTCKMGELENPAFSCSEENQKCCINFNEA